MGDLGVLACPRPPIAARRLSATAAINAPLEDGLYLQEAIAAFTREAVARNVDALIRFLRTHGDKRSKPPFTVVSTRPSPNPARFSADPEIQASRPAGPRSTRPLRSSDRLTWPKGRCALSINMQ